MPAQLLRIIHCTVTSQSCPPVAETIVIFTEEFTFEPQARYTTARTHISTTTTTTTTIIATEHGTEQKRPAPTPTNVFLNTENAKLYQERIKVNEKFNIYVFFSHTLFFPVRGVRAAPPVLEFRAAPHRAELVFSCWCASRSCRLALKTRTQERKKNIENQPAMIFSSPPLCVRSRSSVRRYAHSLTTSLHVHYI